MTNLILTEDHNKVIEHYRSNPGVTPNYETLGFDYHKGHQIYQDLFAAKIIERRKVPSKSGKTMQEKIFLIG